MNPQSHFIFERNNDIGDIARMDYWTDLSGTDTKLYIAFFILKYPETPHSTGWIFEIPDRFIESTIGRIHENIKRQLHWGEDESNIPKLEDYGFSSGE